jgi:UDP-glucose-4-epimerase GalE
LAAVRKVLVTGGAGYVGSHACKALARAGYEPIVFDNLSSGHKWAVKWGPLIVGDILDRTALDETIRHYRPSAVMHFAAFAYVAESVADPAKYYRNNVAGTLTVLDAMHAAGIEQIVFSSTCATYGIPQSLPIREDTPQIPINPYGASKLMVERMLGDFANAYGLRSVALRYFNAAGADPDGEIGEDHDPETHLIPLVLDTAARRRPAIAIFGTDYDTPDGTCMRDYIHVTDLATAHVLALVALEKRGKPVAYNLGNGIGFSVKDVLAAAERVTERQIPFVEKSRRAGDPARLVADATRARRELGWSPKFHDLQVILKTAWHWHQRAHLVVGDHHPSTSDEIAARPVAIRAE